MDISQSTFAMTKGLIAIMNDAVNTVMVRSANMNKCCQELNVLRNFSDNHGLDFAVGDLINHEDVAVYIAAPMESNKAIVNDLLDVFHQNTDFHAEYVGNDYMRIAEDKPLPAKFDEYVLQNSFTAVSPVGQGQQSQIKIYFFAK